jgi:LCP family protein required for cell wall assembly
MSDNRNSIDFLKPSGEINLPENHQPPTDSQPAKTKKRFFSARTKLIFFGAAIMAIGVFLLSTGIAKTSESDDNLSFLSSLRRLVSSNDKPVTGQNDDRINFLLLGIGGSGHQGPELTDTIIFGSLQPSTKEVGLISIPRDLNVDIPGYGYRKINNVNAYAEIANRGSGPEAAAETVEEILGQEVHYTLKVDFKGFEEIIDDIGGIDVYVDKAFTDPTYPLDDELGSVETISFSTGWQHMDGATALKFARSRHGTNGEGSDFARAARQQKILLAVKDKALSLGVLLNPAKLNRIIGTIQDNVDTNMNLWEFIRFAKFIPDITSDKIAMHVLDNRSGLLYETNLNGAYVLLPYEEDWSELHALADNIFSVEQNGTKPATGLAPSNQLLTNVSVEIQNGTATTGLAGETAQLLQGSGFHVTSIGNAAARDWRQTVIFDLTDGQKDEELAALKEYLDAEVYMSTKGYLAASAVIPDEVLATTPGLEYKTSLDPVDFLIILGENSTNLVLR